MKRVTVIMPTLDSSPIITDIRDIAPTLIITPSKIGLPGPKGDQGDVGPQGPGILSNITRITASTTPPENPQENDLWIDLT